jgi:hypothetical protein
MTAVSLLDPVLTNMASFAAWFAVILLGFSMLALIGRK